MTQARNLSLFADNVSSSGTVAVAGINATGTPSSTTYLRGDGTWTTVSLTTGVSGTLPVANGGTNLTSFTANGVVYASSTSALATGSGITYNGTTFSTTNDASINGLTVGRGAGAVSTNTAVGASALAANTTGSQNAAFGWNAGLNNTGTYLTAIGSRALAGNTSGNANTSVGTESLFSNTTASNNTAVGYQAGYSNQTGTSNVAIGYQALYSNTTNENVAVGNGALYSVATSACVFNVAVGFGAAYYTNNSLGGIVAIGDYALNANTTGIGNVAVGSRVNSTSTGTLASNTTGGANTGIGGGALTANTTGSNTTAIGWQSLYSNTTASNNTAVGYQAGYSNTTGISNTNFGYQAGYTNQTGQYNVFVGYQAGYTSAAGASVNAFNTAIGTQAGYSLTTGTINTLVGYYAGGTITTGSKNTIIGGYNGNQGGLDIRTSSNNIVLSDGDGNPRQIINSTGKFLINTTALIAGTEQIAVSFASNTGPALILSDSTIQNGSTFAGFYAASTKIGSITSNGTTGVLYNVISDYRLKDVVSTISDSGSRIDALQTINYTMKADGSQHRGFLAHQFQAIYPNSVSGEKDAVDAEGKPVYQAMQASSPEAMADIFAELQSLRKRLATLESK